MNTFRKRMVHQSIFDTSRVNISCVTYCNLSLNDVGLNHLSFTQPSKPGGGKSFLLTNQNACTAPSPSSPSTPARGGVETGTAEGLWIPKSGSELKTATRHRRRQIKRKRGKIKMQQKTNTTIYWGTKWLYLGNGFATSRLLLGSPPERVSSLWAWLLCVVCL